MIMKFILKTMKLDKRRAFDYLIYDTIITFLLPACLYVYNMCVESRQWDQILLKLLRVVVSCPVWVLSTEPRSFVRAASALEY